MRILFVLFLFSHAVVAQTVWRGATEYPATSMPGEGLALFARLVGDRTAAALTVRAVFDGAGGLRSATIPDAVEAGRIEVGDAFAGALSGVDPIFQLPSLPFLATSIADARRLYTAARPAYDRAFAARGQRLLYVTPWPASGIWSRDRLEGAASLQGLAIRTYDATSTQVMREAGAASVVLSFGDLTPRLADGSVVAVLSSGDGGAGRKLWKYTRHFLAIGYAMPLSFTTVSSAAYAALPEGQRAAVDAAAAETEAAQWQVMVRRTDANEAVMRQNGVSIEQPDAALAVVLVRAGTQVTAAWATRAGPEALAVLQAYRR
jgi:TRAP-type C4-dicarboxylate transport system substrate-binding protein